MGNLAGHQELQRILRPGIICEIDESLVDDLRSCLSRDVAAEIDIELTRDFQVVRRPGVSHGVVKIHAAPPGNGNERIGLSGFALELHRLQVQARQRADDLEMTEFLSADVHQKVLALEVVAIQSLNGILHGGGELAIGSAELLEEHVAE